MVALYDIPTYRVTAMTRGDLNGGKTAITGTPASEEDYALDPVGNWKQFVANTSGTTDINQTRTQNAANEITNINGGPYRYWSTPTYDKNGNTAKAPYPGTSGQDATFTYDAWNRLATDHSFAAPSVYNAIYNYDALGRMVSRKFMTSSGTYSYRRENYFTSDWQLIEERDGVTTPALYLQYVWGLRYLDELVCQDKDTNADGTLDQRLYGCQDGNFNLTALIDTSGANATGGLGKNYSFAPIDHNGATGGCCPLPLVFPKEFQTIQAGGGWYLRGPTDPLDQDR